MRDKNRDKNKLIRGAPRNNVIIIMNINIKFDIPVARLFKNVICPLDTSFV